MADGKKVYQQHCASCHDEADQGAPTIKDAGQWADRSDLWEAVLTEHAKQGYISMPARGGAEGLSDYQVQAATEYMLTLIHPELPAD